MSRHVGGQETGGQKSTRERKSKRQGRGGEPTRLNSNPNAVRRSHQAL